MGWRLLVLAHLPTQQRYWDPGIEAIVDKVLYSLACAFIAPARLFTTPADPAARGLYCSSFSGVLDYNLVFEPQVSVSPFLGRLWCKQVHLCWG